MGTGHTDAPDSTPELYGFLNWAVVQRGHLKPIYIPPAALPETLKPKRVGYPPSDAQILQLLDNLPKGERHERWRFAIQLYAVFGLRPEEMRWLRVKDVCILYFCVMPMVQPSIGTFKRVCRSASNCRH